VRGFNPHRDSIPITKYTLLEQKGKIKLNSNLIECKEKNDMLVLFFQIQRKYTTKRKKTKNSSLISDPKKLYFKSKENTGPRKED